MSNTLASSSSEPSGSSSGFSSLQYKFANASIRALKKSKNAGPFLLPVDGVALGIPHYQTVIERPMDFATIERKLFATVPGTIQPLDDDATASTRYWSVDEWIADVKLVFQNSYTFNGKEHPISAMALALETGFMKQLKKLPTGDEPSMLIISQHDGSINGPQSAITFDDPSSREPSQAPTPFLRNGLDLPPVTATKTIQRSNSSNSEGSKAEQFAYCGKILDHLHKPEFQHFAWFFYNPVQESDVPGYFKVIDKPMSLAVMRDKLDSGQYLDAEAFRADFDQIVWNCNKFNPPGTVAQASGKQLKETFLKKWKMLPGGGLKTVKGGGGVAKPNKITIPPAAKAANPGGHENVNGPPSGRDSLEAPRVNTPSAMIPSMTTSTISAAPTPPITPSVSISRQPSGLLPSILPHPSLSLTSASKRKSDIFREDDEEANEALDHREHLRLERTLHKLKGQELERAVEMLKEGLVGVAPITNERGEEEYPVSSMPESLVRALYDAFVARRVKRRAAKRLKTSDMASQGQAMTVG